MNATKIKKYLVKIISLAAAGIMALSVPFVSFADDSQSPLPDSIPEEDSGIILPDSLLPVILEDDTVRESDLILRQFSVSLAQALATPTGNETAADIYALLYSAFINNPGGTSSFSVTDSSAIAWLQNIAYYLGYNNNSSQASPLYYTLLSGNELSISELMYVLVSQMLNLMDLSATDSSNNPIPLVQLFVQLANDVTGLSTNNSSQLNTIVSIASKLTDSYGSTIANRVYDIWAYMRDTIHGYDFYYTISALNDIKTSSQQLVANTNTVINSLISFNDDFNNINWSFSSDARYMNSNYSQLQAVQVIPANSVFYALYANNNFNSTNRIVKAVIPLTPSDYDSMYNIKIDVECGFYDNGVFKPYNNDYYYYYDVNTYSLNVYFTASSTWFNNTMLKIKSNTNLTFNIQNTSYLGFYYLNNNSNDYFTVYNWLMNLLKSNIMKKIDLLYASDDLIAAKESQQSFEDSALEDFTGSGSAAASTSDLGGLKNVSGTLKSGLPTDGSVNNALSVFNPLSDLWGWFSQSNSDDINNPSLRTRDTVIVDFITQNEIDYYNYLNEGSR